MKKLFCLLTVFSVALAPVVGCGEKPKEKETKVEKEAKVEKETKAEKDVKVEKDAEAK